ncbi:hypothetical protein JCM10212_001027 [Sporobolomyces blumeae]
MAAAFLAYLELSPAQQQSLEAVPALSRLVQALASGQDPSLEHRRRLLSALLSSVPSGSSPSSSTHSDPTFLSLLASALKFLGRSPAGTEHLARKEGIEALVSLGGLRRVADLPRQESNRNKGKGVAPNADEDDSGDDDEAEGDVASAWDDREPDPLKPHEAEALRCLCNVLMLHPSARDVFPTLILADEERSTIKGFLRILGCEGAGFLAGRLLFMLTSKPSEAVVELVQDGDVVEILQDYARRYLVVSRSPSLASNLVSGPMPTPTDVLLEHLKLAYNLMLQYGRLSPTSTEGVDAAHVDRDPADKKKKRFWPSKKDPGYATVTNDDASKGEDGARESGEKKEPHARSKSPLAFAKRVVGAVKSGSGSSTPSSSSASTSPNLSPTPAQASTEGGGADEASTDSLSTSNSQPFLPLFRPYLSLAVTLPLCPPGTSPKDPNPTVRSALNTLLNFPIELEELDGADFSWIQYVPPRVDRDGVPLKLGGIGSLGERLLELLESTCNAYFPVDAVPGADVSAPVASPSARSASSRPLVPPVHPDEWIPMGQGEASKIEEILGPVMLLLRKVSMIGEANEMFRFVLFPPTIDRSKPVDRHPTLAGHLVRLLTSVYLPNTSFGVGEFLYNLADRSPEQLCALIGYGNASGFLQNRGELIPPPPVEAESASQEGTTSRPINPITGAFEAPRDANEVPMTEEEKEREAERLYTLFDRMSRSGVMSAVNPVEQARETGKFEETSDEREAELERLRLEDEAVEKEVERDMAEWRAKRGRPAAPSRGSAA